MMSPFSLAASAFSISTLFAPSFLLFAPISTAIAFIFFSFHKGEKLRYLGLTIFLVTIIVINYFHFFSDAYVQSVINDARAISSESSP
jgi:hypothetical protein